MAVCLSLAFSPSLAAAVEDTAAATEGAEEEKKRSFTTGTAFFDDAALSGGVYYFQRDRRRYDPDRRRYTKNLNHATLQANADFSSGFLGDVVGFDFAVFGSHDIQNTGSVDHEMNFFPWGNPWKPNWDAKRTQDGVSIYKAHVKAKTEHLWARAGYYQPAGPGVLGVNWSIMPGTYQGVNAGADVGGLSVAFAWADKYKAPWFVNMNRFYKNDGESRVSQLWSGGVRYSFENGPVLEAAYGESKGHLWNAHLKTRWETEPAWWGDRVAAGWQLYLMGDNDNSGESVNDNFSGIASHHSLFLHLTDGPWQYTFEGTYTRAPMENEHQAGYFAYRLTDKSGSSKGAYDVWWDARSDWNAHNEKAVFVNVSRALDDWLPVKGFSAGAGAAFGWDGEAYETAEHLKEWAFTLDIGYTKPDGPMKGAFVKVHFTEYRNGTRKGSWDPYKNAFQDEHDIKIFAGIPFDL